MFKFFSHSNTPSPENTPEESGLYYLLDQDLTHTQAVVGLSYTEHKIDLYIEHGIHEMKSLMTFSYDESMASRWMIPAFRHVEVTRRFKTESKHDRHDVFILSETEYKAFFKLLESGWEGKARCNPRVAILNAIAMIEGQRLDNRLSFNE
jgi:integrase